MCNLIFSLNNCWIIKLYFRKIFCRTIIFWRFWVDSHSSGKGYGFQVYKHFIWMCAYILFRWVFVEKIDAVCFQNSYPIELYPRSFYQNIWMTLRSSWEISSLNLEKSSHKNWRIPTQMSHATNPFCTTLLFL